MSMVNRSRHDFIELSFVYFILIVSLVVLSSLPVSHNISKFGIIDVPKKEERLPMFNENEFNDLRITGKAYIVYDIVDKKVIASKNLDEVLPLASLTKLMTAITSITHYGKDKKITITPSSIDGSYDLGLRKNQVWKLSELLKYTLVFSSNDGAQSIADGLAGRDQFIKLMNNDAVLMGLNLQFTQPAGLDLDGKYGGTGSVYDVAKLISIAHNKMPDILDSTTKTRANVIASTGKVTGVPNTNQSINDLVGVEASKTGFTDSAGGNLAVIVDVTVGHPVAIVVLGSTKYGRFSDVDLLYKTLLKSVENSK